MRKRGRPHKGEERAKEASRLERQLTMSLPQRLADLPMACDVGTKRNAKGHTTSKIGNKLHVDTADGGVLISCIMTSASVHDSQVAIPLGTLRAGRISSTGETVRYLVNLPDRSGEQEFAAVAEADAHTVLALAAARAGRGVGQAVVFRGEHAREVMAGLENSEDTFGLR